MTPILMKLILSILAVFLFSSLFVTFSPPLSARKRWGIGVCWTCLAAAPLPIVAFIWSLPNG